MNYIKPIAKLFAIYLSAVCILACNNTKNNKKTTEIILNQDSIQGKALIGKSDCLSCHKPKIRLIGPSFLDLAAKYEANEDNYNLLVQKVVQGGQGVWGPVAMSPHPNILETDVKKMLVYILSQKVTEKK